MRRLEGKTILITGGYTGIGKAIAKACVSEGARVLVNGLRPQLGENLMSELGDGKAAILPLDITENDAPARLVQKAIALFDKLDAVVNNAALVASSDMGSTSVPYLERMLSINTIAPSAIIQAALPELAKTHGAVVNIGSINAWGGEPNLLAYSISKGALMTMTRNLGDTLFREHGVRVNQINPGWVLTDHEKEKQAKDGQPEDWYENLSPTFAPSGRLFRPEEIATLVLQLLDDASGPISGQVWDVEQFPVIGRNPPKS